MPVVFREGGRRFFFYSNEGNPREPPHIHVREAGHETKIWLRPKVAVAYNDGFDARMVRELLKSVEENRERIEKAWGEFFG